MQSWSFRKSALGADPARALQAMLVLGSINHIRPGLADPLVAYARSKVPSEYRKNMSFTVNLTQDLLLKKAPRQSIQIDEQRQRVEVAVYLVETERDFRAYIF